MTGRIGIPYAPDDLYSASRVCQACGRACPEQYDADGERLTNNYGLHYVALHMHAAAECGPDEHDRSLPDGPFRVMDQDLTVLHTGAAVAATALKIAAGHKHAYVTKGEQRVAADGLLGCNDCGEPMYWCRNDENWHHANPEHECFLIGAEA